MYASFTELPAGPGGRFAELATLPLMIIEEPGEPVNP
jgi:hypothetical protein